MQFPKTPRYRYDNNPLKEVVCQLRFPTILRIDREVPTEFQECIRKQGFPYYERVVEHMHNVELEGVNSPFPNALIRHEDSPNHTFTSADKLWRINLTSNFIAISTQGYTLWDNFKAMFERPLAEFSRIYTPAFYNRIGLRYVDAIDRSALGLSETSWSELLDPAMIGMLALNDGSGMQVTQSSQQSEIRLDDHVTMVVRTGFGYIDQPTDDQLFIMDTDTFMVGQFADDEHIEARLDELHEPVNRYFMWAISEKLHDAMKPTKIG